MRTAFAFIGKNGIEARRADTIYYGAEFELIIPEEIYPHGQIVNKLHEEFTSPFSISGDGSLAPVGIEVQAPPISYDAIFGDALDKVWTLIDYLGLYANNTCGGHIHVSTEPLKPEGIERVFKFITKHRAFSTFISGRDFSKRSTTYGDVEDTTIPRPDEVLKKRGSKCGGAVTLNQDTIEFRLFRGVDKREEFYKNVQFCKILCELTETCEPTDEDFISAVDKDEHRFLFPYCTLYVSGKRPKDVPEVYKDVLMNDYRCLDGAICHRGKK